MNFKHVPSIDFEELTARTDEETGRFYYVPSKDVWYPSVTTVLKFGLGTEWLDDWKERVGDEEAKKILTQASIRGEAVHSLAENYMKNDPLYRKGHMPINIHTFNQIKPFLDKHVGLIAGLEVPLYSELLRTAGRVDCIAKWDDIWSIVDFKTSRHPKKEDKVFGYFCQESAYAMMFYERTGKVIPQIVTVMAVDHSEPLIFVKRARDYLPKFIEIRNSLTF